MAIEIKVVYSKRRTVGLSVNDGKILVRAPRGTADTDIKKLLFKHRLWIDKALKKEAARKEKFPECDEATEAKLRAEARVYCSRKIEEYSKITGLKYGRMKITGAKHRFGSCSSKGDICFSYRLMLYHEAFREYVVLHELCHTVFMDHSKRFYSLIEKYMPDYKERRMLAK